MKTKLCTGPAHAEPALLPLDEEHWNFHRSGAKKGEPVSRCKLCQNWGKLVEKKGPHGWVTIGPQEIFFIRELVDRCGSVLETARRHGLGVERLRSLASATEPVRVQKRTIARILTALAEQRRHDRRAGTSPRFNQARKAYARQDELLARNYWPEGG